MLLHCSVHSQQTPHQDQLSKSLCQHHITPYWHAAVELAVLVALRAEIKLQLSCHGGIVEGC